MPRSATPDYTPRYAGRILQISAWLTASRAIEIGRVYT
jgi:hypothetical protein